MSTPTADQPRISRPLVIVLAVVAVLAVGYLALNLLGSSDSEQPEGIADAPVSAPSETGGEIAVDVETADEPSEAPSDVVAVEPTFEIFDARDPFEQLVSNDTGAADGAATVGTTQPATDSTPTDQDPASGGTSGTTPPGSTGSGPSATTVGSTTVLLDDVYTSDGQSTAVVVVDNEGYEAAEGETVGGKVTVLDIAGNCATLRLDDRRFILCEGEQITK